jgi:hypothetical protein
MRVNDKVFLYTGLGILLLALVIRGLGGPSILWISVLCIAIIFKIIFLVLALYGSKFKLELWLIFILVGVLMILISLLFKYVFPIVWLRNVLFYGAISLKVTGLVMMMISKLKTVKNGNKSS